MALTAILIGLAGAAPSAVGTPIFCGVAPQAKSPSPLNDTYSVPLTAQLSWDGGEGRDSITVPAALANVDGNIFLNPPLGALHFQQVYDPSLFSKGGAITSVRFRIDAGNGAPLANNGPWEFTVSLGYSANTSTNVSPTFAANRAPGQVVVFSGPTTFSSANAGFPVREFDFVLPVEGTFDYDPDLGPLLLELTSSGPISALGGNLDASSDRAGIASVANLDLAAASGGVLPYGLVTEFCFEGGNERSRATRFGVIDTSSAYGFDPQAAVFNRLARIPGTSGSFLLWADIASSSAASLRERYDVIYFPGDAVAGDFTDLSTHVAPAGVLEQYTALGGVLVIVASTNSGSHADIAPGGVDYIENYDNTITINATEHPFVTGKIIRGAKQTDGSLSYWGSSSHGTFGELPASGSTVIAGNPAGPVLAEYRYGAGLVIVTGLTIGWDLGNPESRGMSSAFTNLLRLAAERSRPARIGVLGNAPFNGFNPPANTIENLALLPNVRGTLLPWSDITQGSASRLRQRFDAILFSGSPSPDDFGRLQAAAAGGGVLDIFAQIGGSLAVVTSTNLGNQSDIAPGGTDYTQAYHNQETLNTSSFYVSNGVAEGPFLTADLFNNWDSTDHGTLSGFPAVDVSNVLTNTDGVSMAEYAWGQGHVLVTTITVGWLPYAPFNGEPFNNLLRLIGFKGRRGACPTNYNVYFGTDNPPTSTILTYGTVGEGFDPGPLAADTRYYWQVNSIRENSGSGGQVWTFSTGVNPGRAQGDFDNSGCTDINDFLFLLDYWNIASPIGGGPIDINDFLALLDYWNLGALCPV